MSSAASMGRETSLQIQEQLKLIWQAYNAAGITKNQEIVEALALELSKLAGKPHSALLGYAQPTLQPSHATLQNIQRPLQRAVQLAGNAATLFDRYLLFQKADRAEGALYPLPRHLIDSIVRLLKIEFHHSFADFTCGSGGFLVNRNNVADDERSTHGITLGIELDPTQDRLAEANLLLHDLVAESRLFFGNALSLCATNPTSSLFDDPETKLLQQQLFDRIAMAAPFGEDAKEDARLWSKDGGNTSEDVFTRLALAKLADGGRAALLIPSSLTWKDPRSMATLRQRMLNQHTVHAVISLPKSALSPFNVVNASILILSKEAAPPDHQIWLLKVTRDGYAVEGERDLQMPPDRSPAQSDLPLIEAIFPTLPESNPIASSGLRLAPILLSPNEQFHGLLLQAEAETRPETLRLFRVAPTQPGRPVTLYLLVKTSHPFAPCAVLIPFTVNGLSNSHLILRGQFVFSHESEARKYIQEMHQLQQVPDSISIYNNGLPGQSIVIASDGRVLGIMLPHTSIEGNDLQPERYVPEPEKAFANANPVETINSMYQQQPVVARHLDTLLGQLEVKPVVAADLPPLVLPRASADECTLEQALGTNQQVIWQWILNTQIVTHGQHEYPRYFTSQEIIAAFSSNPADQNQLDRLAIQATLDLLVCMGLLVFVLIIPPESSSPLQENLSVPGRPLPYYRLLTTLDITNLNSQEVYP